MHWTFDLIGNVSRWNAKKKAGAAEQVSTAGSSPHRGQGSKAGNQANSALLLKSPKNSEHFSVHAKVGQAALPHSVCPKSLLRRLQRQQFPPEFQRAEGRVELLGDLGAGWGGGGGLAGL